MVATSAPEAINPTDHEGVAGAELVEQTPTAFALGKPRGDARNALVLDDVVVVNLEPGSARLFELMGCGLV